MTLLFIKLQYFCAWFHSYIVFLSLLN